MSINMKTVKAITGPYYDTTWAYDFYDYLEIGGGDSTGDLESLTIGSFKNFKLDANLNVNNNYISNYYRDTVGPNAGIIQYYGAVVPFGASTSSGMCIRWAPSNSSNNYFGLWVAGTRYDISDDRTASNSRALYELNNGTFKYNNTTMTDNLSWWKLIFGSYTGDGTADCFSRVRIYSCWTWKKYDTNSDDNYEHYYYPVVRKSDSRPGLLDIKVRVNTKEYVSQTFIYGSKGQYTQASVGTQVAPPAIYKTVKKIEDTNGNILWGTQSAFPYRKLEYIHFNGAERIQTDFYPGTYPINYKLVCTSDELVTSGNRSIMDLYDNDLINNMKRFYFLQQNSTGIHACLGDTWSSYATSTPINTKLTITATYNKVNNQPRLYYFLSDGTSNIISANPLAQNTVGDLSTTVPLSLGCRIISNNGYTYDYYWKGNVYSLQRRQNNSSGALLTSYIPVQRKSDGVCGMYDTITNTFHPMVGTTITDAAAGPTVDEYWNLN